MIQGSRKQKELTADEIERVAAVCRTFRRTGKPEAVAGFCRVATLDEVREHKYALTPGRYVGSPDGEEDEEDFEEKLSRLVTKLLGQFEEAGQLEAGHPGGASGVGLWQMTGWR